jgi:hypothetical protein
VTAPAKYLFAISAGRGGSHYLADLFGCARGCRAEPKVPPFGNREALVAFNRGDEVPLRAQAEEILAGMGQGPWTSCFNGNHTFIKGFGWIVPELVPADELGVVVLRRTSPGQVASILRSFPIGTSHGDVWGLEPEAPRNRVPAPPATAGLEARCAWLLEEVEARTQEWRERFPEVRCLEVVLEDLTDPARVRGLFDAFGLVPDEARLAEATLPYRQYRTRLARRLLSPAVARLRRRRCTGAAGDADEDRELLAQVEDAVLGLRGHAARLGEAAQREPVAARRAVLEGWEAVARADLERCLRGDTELDPLRAESDWARLTSPPGSVEQVVLGLDSTSVEERLEAMRALRVGGAALDGALPRATDAVGDPDRQIRFLAAIHLSQAAHRVESLAPLAKAVEEVRAGIRRAPHPVTSAYALDWLYVHRLGRWDEESRGDAWVLDLRYGREEGFDRLGRIDRLTSELYAQALAGWTLPPLARSALSDASWLSAIGEFATKFEGPGPDPAADLVRSAYPSFEWNAAVGYGHARRSLLEALLRRRQGPLAADDFPEAPLGREAALRTCLLLRLSLCLLWRRHEVAQRLEVWHEVPLNPRGPARAPAVRFEPTARGAVLTLPVGWLDRHPGSRICLEEEAAEQRRLGYTLEVRDAPSPGA